MKKQLVLTGGSYAGRKLYVPGSGVRPATNLVREAIFSTLRSFFEEGVSGKKVLDLFAGTGSLGLEALSRNASLAVFVDKGRESVRSIRKNLETLGFSGEVMQCDAMSYLKRHRGLTFDVVFMDPPYRYTRGADVVEQLTVSLAAGNKTLLIYERFFTPDPPDFGKGSKLVKRKKYGQSEILYYRIDGAAEVGQ